ncbi:MAG: hypothetical protein K6T51_03275 [Rubrobacteraceae bacterium]|nr:hypothetical protein [Rubrobacteraceae bacterium]
MNKERINAALRDAPDTQRVLIGEGVLFSVGEVFGECFGNQPAVVVADENTWAVAGEEVHRRLQSARCKTLEP